MGPLVRGAARPNHAAHMSYVSGPTGEGNSVTATKSDVVANSGFDVVTPLP